MNKKIAIFIIPFVIAIFLIGVIYYIGLNMRKQEITEITPEIIPETESKTSCLILDEKFCHQGKMIYDSGQLVGLGFKLPEGSKIYAPFKGLSEGRKTLVEINNKHYSTVDLMDISKEDWGQYSTGTYFFAIGYHQLAEETGKRVEIEKGKLFASSGTLTVDNSLGDYNLILNFKNVNFETGEWTNNSGLLKEFFNYID